MHEHLVSILAHKRKEIQNLYDGNIIENSDSILAVNFERNYFKVNDFKKSISSKNLSVIAEVKRCSPSKGRIADILNPVELAEQYVKGGASAVSVLTEQHYFNGSNDDLVAVSKSINVPILRKDFILDPIQLIESKLLGAHAILAIVAILGKDVQSILSNAKDMGLDVIVEVHDAYEIELALKYQANIIGVNNRNLLTFEVDHDRAFELKKYIPDNVLSIAESGILSPKQANEYYQAGYNSVLIGEALVKSKDPEQFIRACQSE